MMKSYLDIDEVGHVHDITAVTAEDLIAQARDRASYQEDSHTLKLNQAPDALELYLHSIKNIQSSRKE